MSEHACVSEHACRQGRTQPGRAASLVARRGLTPPDAQVSSEVSSLKQRERECEESRQLESP